jgi:hypothetical protein
MLSAIGRLSLEPIPNGLSGRAPRDSKRLFKPSWEASDVDPQLLAGSIVARGFDTKRIEDAEWLLVEPLLPAPKRTGRPLS